MSSSQTILHGNLGKDPEIFRTDNDFPIATFSLATTRRTGDGNGGTTEVTDWHNVKALGKTAEVVEKYLQKGKEVIIFGHNETRDYEKNGEKRYITEVMVDRIDFCGSSSNSSSGQNQNGTQNNRNQNNQNQNRGQGQQGGGQQQGNGQRQQGNGYSQNNYQQPQHGDDEIPY